MAPKPQVIERRLVDFPPPTPQATPCRLWQGVAIRGYGRKRDRVKKRTVLLHRWIWEQAYGPVPPGMNVLHKCDNPPCYRLDHLFLGTQAENVADMDAKGRGNRVGLWPGRRGENAGGVKLTEAQVREIKSLHATGEWLQRELAARYGVTRTAVYDILSGRKWRHVEFD